MEFYEQLSEVYDDLFPASEQAVGFLADRCPGDGRVLDVACGSGEHALKLAGLGFTVVGIDMDRSMIAKAKQKPESGGVPTDDLDDGRVAGSGSLRAGAWSRPDFRVGDMLMIEKICRRDDPFDLAYCIGNSMVHLRSEADVLSTLRGMQTVLAETGTCVVQIVHFDRIFRRGIHELPPLTAADGTIRLNRYYDYAPGDETVDFRTKLIRNEPTRDELEQSVRLIALTRERLETLLYEAGFEEIAFFGGFDGSPLADDSFALIASAR